MTQIKFSETELTELQSFYKQELDKTLKRAEDIKAILKKINSPQTNTATHIVKPIKSLQVDASSDIKTKAITNGKVEGSPVRVSANYSAFILDTLSASKKPLRKSNILPLLVKHFNISSKQDKTKAERNLRTRLLGMTKRGEINTVKRSGVNIYSALNHTTDKPSATKPKAQVDTSVVKTVKKRHRKPRPVPTAKSVTSTVKPVKKGQKKS